ncbi:MAG: hypothetical protein FWH48_00455, partial [Oscillospiraceae bacterium]|nr:hypothetical protein [Oscillospiraceae bacterium]
LGIQPVKAGFAEYKVRPLTAGLDFAEGGVPTPRGDIEFEWKKTAETFSATLTSPTGTVAEVHLPKAGNGEVYINGMVKTVETKGDCIVLKDITPGSYEFLVK